MNSGESHALNSALRIARPSRLLKGFFAGGEVSDQDKGTGRRFLEEAAFEGGQDRATLVFHSSGNASPT